MAKYCRDEHAYAAFGTALARKLILDGFLEPGNGGVVATRDRIWCVDPQSTLDEERRRAARDFPELDTLPLAEEFRALMDMLDPGGSPPPARIEQLARTLLDAKNGGTHRLHAQIMVILGGSYGQNAKYIRAVVEARSEGEALGADIEAASVELGAPAREMIAFARLGILTADGAQCNDRPHRCDLTNGSVAETLKRRLEELPSAPYSLQRVGDVRSAKRILGIPPDGWIPPSLVRDCVGWHEKLNASYSVSDIQMVIGGGRDQLLSIIKASRKDGTVTRFRSSRPPKEQWTVDLLSECVHPQLAQARSTVLDEHSYDPVMMPADHILSTIQAISNPTMKIIADVVILHAFSEPTYRSQSKVLHHPLVRLDAIFEGLDPTNAGDVKRALDAYYLVALADDETALRRMLDILQWRKIVEVFESYEQTPRLPVSLRNFLGANRPALPVADHIIFDRAWSRREELLAKNRKERFERLSNLLDSVPEYLADMDDRRKETQSLRATIIKKQRKNLPWPDEFNERVRCEPITEEHTTKVPHGPKGRRTRTITFKIHTWDSLLERLQFETRRDLRETMWTPGIMRDGFQGDLFENRFAVEFVSCLYEDGSVAKNPYWFDFHLDLIFDQSRRLSVEETERRMARIQKFNLSEGQFRHRMAGCGNFAKRWSVIARYVREDFGMVLLPIEEHDHFEAVAIYALTSRTSTPVRPGEHAAFDIGENLEGFDYEGEVSSVFTAPRKMKDTPHEFILSSKAEARADELLTITRRRKYGGGPIPDTPRPRGSNPRTPERAKFVLAYGKTSFSTQAVDIAINCISVGYPRFQGRDAKLLWNMLEKGAGKTIGERSQEQGHTTTQVTEKHYDPKTSEDRTIDIEIQRAWHVAREKEAKASATVSPTSKVKRLAALQEIRKALDARIYASNGNDEALFVELAEISLEMASLS